MKRLPYLAACAVVVSSVMAQPVVITGDVQPSPASSPTWVIGGPLTIGNTGSGSLQITAGGTVSNTFGYLGKEIGSLGSATVSGGSWTSTETLVIGMDGSGTLTLSGMGAVQASQITLGSSSGASGTIHLNGGVLTTGQITKGFGSGSVVFGGGILRVSGNQGALFQFLNPGDVTIDSGGGTIDTQAFTVGSSYGLSGIGMLTKTGSGTLSFTGANSYTGGTTLRAGKLVVGPSGEIQHASSEMNIGLWNGDNGTLEVSGGEVANGIAYIGYETGAVGHAKITAGSWANDSLNVGFDGTGTLEVSGGTVTADTAYIGKNADGSGTVMLNGGTMNVTGDTHIGFDGDGSLEITSGAFSTGDLFIARNNDATGRFAVGGGTTAITYTLYNTGTMEITNGVVSTSDFSQYEPYEQTGHPSFTTISGGNLNVAGVIDLAGESTFEVTGSGHVTAATALVGRYLHDELALLKINGNGILEVGTLRVGRNQNGALELDDNGSLVTTRTFIGDHYQVVTQATATGGTWTASEFLAVGGAGDGLLEISGTASISTPKLIFGDFSDTFGEIHLNGGTLTVGEIVKGAGNGTLTFNGGTLRLSADQADLFSALDPGAVTLGSGGGTIDTYGHTATLHYDLGGTGGLTKAGSGTLILSGTPSYGGGTVVKGGTLSITTNANLGPIGSTLTLDGGALHNAANLMTYRHVVLGAEGGVFDVDSGYLTLQTPVSGSGGLTKTGGNILTLEGNQTYAGATAVNAGAFKVENGTLASGSVALAAGTILYWANTSGPFSYEGNISGEGNVVKQGSDIITLSGENTHTGTTTVEAGKLVARSDGALSAASTLTVNTGATLSIFGDANEAYVIEMGGLSGGGTVEIGANSYFIVGGNNASTTFSGSIIGIGSDGGFEKTGSGKLILTGTSNFEGFLDLCSCYESSNHLEIQGGSVTTANYGIIDGGTLSVVAGGYLKTSGLLVLGTVRTEDAGSIVETGDVFVGGNLESGTIAIGEGTTVTAQSVTVEAGGILVLNGGLGGNPAVSIEDGGTLRGAGTLEGNLTINGGGILSPGNSPGTLTVNGDLTLLNDSITKIEISSDTIFDRLDGIQEVAFDGILEVTFLDAFVPEDGDHFDLFSFVSSSGTFSSILFSNPEWSGIFDASIGVLEVNLVPEPGTIWLLVGGMAIAFLCHRRRLGRQ